MILLLVEETWHNDADTVKHMIVDTTEEVNALKEELEAKKMRYRDQGFYSYDFYVQTVDINEVKIDELKGLTLKEVKRLLESVK